MGAIVSQITSLMVVYSTVYSDADQRKYQSFASLAFVRGIHRGPVNYPHMWPVTQKMFAFDDVIMKIDRYQTTTHTGGAHRGIGTGDVHRSEKVMALFHICENILILIFF